MTTAARRVRALWENYVRRQVRGRPSPLTFWALPEPPVVVSPEALAAYLAAAPSPPYLMDYTAKLAYTETDAAGIPVLHYPDPVGTRVNPEAAFQLALGFHDRWRNAGGEEDRRRFLALAAHFATDQAADGLWLYRFRWHRSPDPWGSALAQMRGASVMIRAWQLTGEDRFARAARAAAEPLARPLAEGGMHAVHRQAGVPYFEEYPSEPTAVLNGFLAALFGLYELATWLDDTRARRLLDEGLASAEALIPCYVHRGWTLYDLDPATPFPNPNSPRYHRLVGDYLAVLATLSGRPALAGWRDRWRALDTPANRVRAVAGKALRKLRYK